MKRRFTPAAALLATAVAAVSGGLLTLPAHAAGPSQHVVGNTLPSWATSSASRGLMAPGAVINGHVELASRNPAGLARFAVAVSTPGNALYQHYLSPAVAASRFGSRPGASGDVAAWLRSNGLKVTSVDRHQIAFSGTAAKVGSAFGVSFHTFLVGGRLVHAPSTAAKVPASLSGDVLTVLGLSSHLATNKPMLVHSSAPTSAKPTATPFPCSAYEGQKLATKYPKAYGKVQPLAVCGYQPAQLRGAYGVTASGFTGKGITMAVVDAYALPTMAKDAKTWSQNRGEKPFAKGQYKEYIPQGTGYNAGWAGEEALDIEAIHSMAPDANVAYVAAQTPSDTAFLAAFDNIIDNHIADAVNNSWEGGTDSQAGTSTIAAFENRFQMGATEGIGFYFSTGDSGGGGTSPYVLYPSVDPFVTAVGGSAIGIDKSNKYMYETAWETDYTAISGDGKSWDPAPPGVYTSGAGGGTSVVFKQPKWQKGVVPKVFSEAHGKTPMRTSPDIGAVADPTTGFLEGFSTLTGGKYVYAENRIGGTSLSSPLIVGMQAVAEQANGGKAIGFANPSIYALAGSNAYHDVASDSLSGGDLVAHVRLNGSGVVALATAGQSKDAGLASVKGYDTTVGVGTPTVNYYKSFAFLP